MKAAPAMKIFSKPTHVSAKLSLSTAGSHDDTLLLCNRAGLQIRPMIKFEPDAMCLQINSRYRALYDIVGEIKYTLGRLLKELGEPNPAGLSSISVGLSSENIPRLPSVSLMESWSRELAYSGMDASENIVMLCYVFVFFCPTG